MKTENMTFSEAFEAMKQGYKVTRHNAGGYLRIEGIFVVDENNEEWKPGVFATDDWKIYNEPKPEPQFEIGELVMMRDKNSVWTPKFYSHKTEYEKAHTVQFQRNTYKECAKFDKDIVFTNKPAK